MYGSAIGVLGAALAGSLALKAAGVTSGDQMREQLQDLGSRVSVKLKVRLLYSAAAAGKPVTSNLDPAFMCGVAWSLNEHSASLM